MFLALSWAVPKNMAMPNDWNDALTWVGENTEQDDGITVWWSYGWWTYDIADRGTPATQATDPAVNAIAQIYYAPSPVQAQVIMQQNGWTYLVMSTREREFMESIRSRVPGAEGDGDFYSSVMVGDVPTVYRNASVVVLKAPWVG
jgi:asparagine N-glycosylation enzyme membrane subunit Stt3